MKILNKIEEARGSLTEIARQREYPATPETHQLLKEAEKIARDLTTSLQEIDDDGNRVHNQNDADMLRMQGDITANLNKYTGDFRKDVYDKCLAQPKPIQALLEIGVMDRVSFSIGANKEGEPVANVNVGFDWVNILDFGNYAASKDRSIFTNDPNALLNALYIEVMTTTLQRFYLDYCDADNEKGRKAALAAAEETIGISQWTAVKEFNSPRSRKVVKAKMGKALSALYNDEYRVDNSDFAFIMNAGLVYANQNVAKGLSCIKPVTLKNLCTRLLIARVHNVDLELLK